MFYSFAWTDPQKGARKKIHGGSGLQNNGDSYGPGSACSLPCCVLFNLRSHYSCRFLGIP
jgi:hypothetical protein